MPWLSTIVVVDGRTYAHTIPLEDKIDHDEAPDCVCGPLVRQILGTGLEYGWEIVHGALDGRELVE